MNIDNMYEILDTLSSRLKELSADLEEGQTLEKIIEEECESFIKKNISDSETLLGKVTDYIDNTEERTNEVCSNIGKFQLKLAKKMDEMHKALTKMTHEYEIKKAVCADQNDEQIDSQQESYNKSKDKLRKSVHHIKLEENLQASFQVLDELEQEYREFHKRNVKISGSHEDIIVDTFYRHEIKFATHFELYAAFDEKKKAHFKAANEAERSKKARWLLKLRLEEEKRQEEEEEKRQLEEDQKEAKDGKKKAKGKKKVV